MTLPVPWPKDDFSGRPVDALLIWLHTNLDVMFWLILAEGAVDLLLAILVVILLLI